MDISGLYQEEAKSNVTLHVTSLAYRKKQVSNYVYKYLDKGPKATPVTLLAYLYTPEDDNCIPLEYAIGLNLSDDGSTPAPLLLTDSIHYFIRLKPTDHHVYPLTTTGKPCNSINYGSTRLYGRTYLRIQQAETSGKQKQPATYVRGYYTHLTRRAFYHLITITDHSKPAKGDHVYKYNTGIEFVGLY